MSLIPSESYSFPDHFTSTVTPSRKPKQKPEAKQAPRKPAIVALPDPEPEPELEVFAAAEESAVEPEVISDAWQPEPMPEPELMAEIWEPEMPEVKAAPPPPSPVRPAPPKPNPAIRRAQAPPPRVPETPPVRKIALPATLKPKVRWNNRTPALDPARNGNGNGAYPPAPVAAPTPTPTSAPAPAPAPVPLQNVIPMTKAVGPALPPQPRGLPRPAPKPAPVANKPVLPPAPRKPAAPEMRPVQLKPKPVAPKPAPPVASNSQSDFLEIFEENGYELANKRRKQMKFRRFVTCEAAALLVLLPLVILGLTLNISAPAVRWIMNLFTIAAAIAAAVIPIAFYAFTPTLPELER